MHHPLLKSTETVRRVMMKRAVALLVWLIATMAVAAGTAVALRPAPLPVSPVEQLHFILRPDTTGRWYIQNDVDHASVGMLPTIQQGPDFLRVFFAASYAKAVAIHVTSDDDFRGKVQGHSNLGLTTQRFVSWLRAT